jgi:hypothetical protein
MVILWVCNDCADDSLGTGFRGGFNDDSEETLQF